MAKLSSQLGTAADTKHTKYTKAEANYSDKSYDYPSDKGPRDHCGSCISYEPDEHNSGRGTCELVSGSIDFEAVCDYYKHRVYGGSVESGDSGDKGSSGGDEPVAAEPE